LELEKDSRSSAIINISPVSYIELASYFPSLPKLFLLLVTHPLPDVLSEHNASREIHPRFRVFDASVITLGPDNDLGCQQ
jgi:hypothetical protein